ncbi:MAG: hypothetical protein WCW52_06300 [Elusimicrobiales bacterium]
MKKLLIALGVAAAVNPACSSALNGPFESGSKFECMSADSKVLFTLDILDAGDKKAEVTVDASGAPKTLAAVYSDGRFVFGAGMNSIIELPSPVYHEWVVGRVEHAGMNEKLICQFGDAVEDSIPASFSSRSAFSCLGTRTERMYDLDIVDIGDDEGTVEINDSGAPKTFPAYFRDGSFMFGDSLIQLDRPSWYEWTIGRTENVKGASEPLVCKSREYQQ